MADVFISYHVESAGEIVRQIAEELSRSGISYWYAADSIYAGDLVGVITREIRECKVFLLILNQDALKSRYVESEVALAYRRMMNYEKLTFLPVRVDECDWKETPIAFYLRHTQMINGVALPALCERVARIVGGKSSPRLAVAKKNRALGYSSADNKATQLQKKTLQLRGYKYAMKNKRKKSVKT